MTAIKRQFVDGPFGQIHVRVAQCKGPTNEPPLVMLHMFPQSGRNFVDVMPLLAERRTVIAPDFPGFGESDPPLRQISAEQYAGAIWAVLEKLDIESGPVDLFGIHAGAKLAVEATAQKHNAVRRLALCSAAILTPEEVAEYWAVLRKIPLDRAGSRFETFWKMQADYLGPDAPLDLIAMLFQEMQRGGESYHWGHAAVFDYNELCLERVRSLEHPI